MKIIETYNLTFPEIKVYKFGFFEDVRGYFAESFRFSDLNLNVVQINESKSLPNVARGLHFQWNPYMGKLVRTIYGHMIDLVLDIRINSPTFGKIVSYDMPERDNYGEWIYIPPGFAHGNYYLKETKIQYLCTGEYNGKYERGISLFDPEIDWSLSEHSFIKDKNDLIVSDKDRANITLKQWAESEGSKEFKYSSTNQTSE